jgi:hypothetical protein
MGARTEACSKFSLFCHKMSQHLKDRFEIHWTWSTWWVLRWCEKLLVHHMLGCDLWMLREWAQRVVYGIPSSKAVCLMLILIPFCFSHVSWQQPLWRSSSTLAAFSDGFQPIRRPSSGDARGVPMHSVKQGQCVGKVECHTLCIYGLDCEGTHDFI